jgi:homoserine/homoserine lactone efflux protein
MTIEAWLLFCLTEVVLCCTPGPAVMLVTSRALTRGAAAGMGASAGVLAANALYFILSGTGVGAALLASWELFFLIKWVGAAYLLWLGVRMLGGRAPAGVQDPAVAATSLAGLAPFRDGVVAQGANPKTLLYFTALLPQFVDPHAHMPTQIAILGISSVLIELAVLGFYVLLCLRARALMRRPGWEVHLRRAGGVLLIGAGAGLATLRRS